MRVLRIARENRERVRVRDEFEIARVRVLESDVGRRTRTDTRVQAFMSQHEHRVDVTVKQGRARGVYGYVEMNAAMDKGIRLSVQSDGSIMGGRALYSTMGQRRIIDTRLEKG